MEVLLLICLIGVAIAEGKAQTGLFMHVIDFVIDLVHRCCNNIDFRSRQNHQATHNNRQELFECKTTHTAITRYRNINFPPQRNLTNLPSPSQT